MNAIEFVKKNGIEKSKIHLDRMKSALSAESFVMPQGLSREEKRKFIMEAGKSNQPSGAMPMTKILCLFGFHAFEYEENILTGKRYKVCRHCGVNREA